MKKLALVLSLALVFGVQLFGVVTPVSAAEGDGPYLGLEYGRETGLGQSDLRVTVANIIKVVLGLLGTIGLALIFYAGFLWMTAAGNDDQVGKAKNIIFAAVIGLAIILSAYSITTFVFNQLVEATKTDNTVPTAE